MSTVALEAEERATLAAALALVDDCDPPVWRPLVTTTAGRETRAVAGAVQHEPEQSARPSLSSSFQTKRCDHRKRHRTEIARLRDQVVDLEAHLTQLQRYCGRDAPAVKRARVQASRKTGDQLEPAKFGARLLSQLWFKKAVAEFKMLQRAKQQNLDLKDAVQEQRNVSAALEQLFQLKLSKQDLDFLSEVAKQNAENGVSDPKNDPRPSPFADMLAHLEKLYASTPEIISQISIRRNMSRIFHSSHSERDPVLGSSSHEFTTNTPLTCSLRELEQFIWQQVQVSARIECRKPCHHFHQAPQVKQMRNSCETHVDVEFNEAVGDRRMDGMFVIRKFVEPHRVVLTLTARITFSGSALVIREDGWVVMNDQSASSSASCNTLLQTHYRIHVEKQDPKMTQDMEHLREFVVDFLSEKMKSNKLQMRDLMLQIQDAVGMDKIQRELSFECIACGFDATLSS